MERITIRAVKKQKEFDDFLRFGNYLYANSSCYVPDLEMDIRATFDPKKNSALEYAVAQPFVALKDGKVVGRIAPFINKRSNERWHSADARFMYLDFVDDLQVSSLLLKTAEDWSRQHGMRWLKGPLGFTDFDKEGMLVSDFDLMGTVNTLYNFPYYPVHMEAAEFKKAVDWVQVQVRIPETLPERYLKTARLCRQYLHLKVRTLTPAEVRGGYGKRIFDLINEAYAPLYGFTKIEDQQIEKFIKTYLPFVDLRLVPVVENERGEIVGVAVCMPSMSEVFRRMKGRLLPFGWYHLWRGMSPRRSKRVELLLIGVRPELQGLGVNTLFFEHLIPIFHELGYEDAETGPQLETNKNELSQWRLLNPRIVKRRRCYQKELGSGGDVTTR
jgi:GNAT superfamily N-acetyltransferase